MDPVSMYMMGGIAGNLISGFGAQGAARTQAAGAQNASLLSGLFQQQGINAAQQMFGQAKETLAPYTSAGGDALKMLMGYVQGTGAQQAGVGGGGANLLSTFAPTMEQLESTPGYQWARKQALGAMTNAGAAKGLGASGNLVQGIGEAATGLASQTFNDQLKNYMAQNLQAYNMLMGPSELGGRAAGQLAQSATGLGGQMIGAYTNLGNTMGAGTMGSANALAGGQQALSSAVGTGISNAASLPMLAQMYGGAGQTRNPYGQVGPSDLWNFASGQSSPFPSQGYNVNYAGGAR
jgi:hypothetical protein